MLLFLQAPFIFKRRRKMQNPTFFYNNPRTTIRILWKKKNRQHRKTRFFFNGILRNSFLEPEHSVRNLGTEKRWNVEKKLSLRISSDKGGIKVVVRL
jgi:hypothetical protein